MRWQVSVLVVLVSLLALNADLFEEERIGLDVDAAYEVLGSREFPLSDVADHNEGLELLQEAELFSKHAHLMPTEESIAAELAQHPEQHDEDYTPSPEEAHEAALIAVKSQAEDAKGVSAPNEVSLISVQAGWWNNPNNRRWWCNAVKGYYWIRWSWWFQRMCNGDQKWKSWNWWWWCEAVQHYRNVHRIWYWREYCKDVPNYKAWKWNNLYPNNGWKWWCETYGDWVRNEYGGYWWGKYYWNTFCEGRGGTGEEVKPSPSESEQIKNYCSHYANYHVDWKRFYANDDYRKRCREGVGAIAAKHPLGKGSKLRPIASSEFMNADWARSCPAYARANARNPDMSQNKDYAAYCRLTLDGKRGAINIPASRKAWCRRFKTYWAPRDANYAHHAEFKKYCLPIDPSDDWSIVPELPSTLVKAAKNKIAKKKGRHVRSSKKVSKRTLARVVKAAKKAAKAALVSSLKDIGSMSKDATKEEQQAAAKKAKKASATLRVLANPAKALKAAVAQVKAKKAAKKGAAPPMSLPNPSAIKTPYNPLKDPNVSAYTPIAISSSSSKVLDIAGERRTPGSALILWNNRGTAGQKWATNSQNLLFATFGRRGRQHTRCIQIHGRKAYDGVQLTTARCSKKRSSQKFRYSSASGALTHIKSGLCVSLLPASGANGFQIGLRFGLQACSGAPNQAFSFGSSAPIVPGFAASPPARTTDHVLTGAELNEVLRQRAAVPTWAQRQSNSATRSQKTISARPSKSAVAPSASAAAAAAPAPAPAAAASSAASSLPRASPEKLAELEKARARADAQERELRKSRQRAAERRAEKRRAERAAEKAEVNKTSKQFDSTGREVRKPKFDDYEDVEEKVEIEEVNEDNQREPQRPRYRTVKSRRRRSRRSL